jgi:NADPH2:quinone reductase
MGMAAVIHKKGAPDNFVWEEIKVGSPGRGQVRLRSTAVGVNFADTYHRAGIPHPMIVGDPPVVVGFEGVGEIEELGPGVTGFSVGERVCTCLPPLGAYGQERLYPADKLIKVPEDLPLDDVQLAGLILVASNVVKTFPLREAAAAHKFIGGRKTTGSIVMLPFE